MKSAFHRLGPVLLVPALLVASAPALAAPRASVEPEVLQLGKIDEGRKYERVIELTNVGDGILVLEDVKTSCGCTAAAVDEKVELGAGQTQQIRVSFNTAGLEGDVKKNVTVITNDEQAPRIKVDLTANIYRPVKWTPRFVGIGQVRIARAVAEVVKLESDLAMDLQVKDAWVRQGIQTGEKSELFTVDVSERREKGPRHEVEFTLRMTPDPKPQRVAETLVIVTNNADHDTLAVPVRGEVVGRLSATPAYALLAMVDPGKETTRDVVVSSIEGPFQVVNASVPDSPVTVDVTMDELSKKATLRLTYVGEKAGTSAVRELQIQTDDPVQDMIRIPVRYQTSTATASGSGS